MRMDFADEVGCWRNLRTSQRETMERVGHLRIELAAATLEAGDVNDPC